MHNLSVRWMCAGTFPQRRGVRGHQCSQGGLIGKTYACVPLRHLGKDGPKVAALGFGLMGLSGAYGLAPSDEERFEILDRALELGATFWDSSDAYGDNEELLGKWFRRTGKRDEIFLATKFGVRRASNFISVDDAGKARVNPTALKMSIDSSGEYCKRACEASLKKLGLESIDLYYVHRVDPQTPIEETMRALAELQEQGKIKHIGLSEVSSATLRRAHKVASVSAVQVEYSAFVLDIETPTGTHLLRTCRELGIAVVSYSPLGRGLLTGAYTTKESLDADNDLRRSVFPRFSDENFAVNVKLVNTFTAMADRKGCTPSQLALGWLLKQGDDIIPIPGTKKIKYLEQNWAALDVQLTDAEEMEIRRFAEGAEVAGDRTLALGMKLAFGDTREEDL